MITARLDEGKIRLSFPYDGPLIAEVKAISGSRYCGKPTHDRTLPISLASLHFLKKHNLCESAEVLTAFGSLLKLEDRRVENVARAAATDASLPDFPFRMPPMAHQRVGTRLLLDNPVFAILDEMGTGKSKVSIDAACMLYEAGTIEGVLVVCPNTVKGNWAHHEWGQLAAHVPERVPVHVQRVDSKDKKRFSVPSHKEGLEWVVVNYEGLLVASVNKVLHEWLKTRSVMIVLDESDRIKGHKSLRTKAATSLGKLAARKVIMTGTPIAKDPLDFYAQFYFLDPNILGHHTFTTFKAHYAKLEEKIFRHKGVERPVKIITGWNDLDGLEARVASFSRRILKKECLDLPDKVYSHREVAMSKEQWQHYEALEENLITEVEGRSVATPIVLTKLLRLSQIAAGFLPLAEAGITDTKHHRFAENPKVDAAMEFLTDEATGKTILFCLFHEEIAMLEERLAQAKIVYRVISGKVKGERRDNAWMEFQNDPTVMAIVVQVATGGIGIPLFAAEHVLYLTNSQSHRDRAQSEDRAHRQGTKHTVTYIDILVTTPDGCQTTDHVALQNLREKKDVADVVLGDRLKHMMKERKGRRGRGDVPQV